MPVTEKRIFVSIAVSKPDGGLEALPGAITASERMAAWARAHGYIALLINDVVFREVTVDLLRTEISAAIAELTSRAELERLIIFFAGHGAALGIDDQNWMLSNWNKRPSEAVNISSLQRMLEYYGPKQVTIIGDACQEYSRRFIDITGGPILDRLDEERRDFELDRFFPVDAGSQAFMIKARGQNEAFCLFTEVMLDVLEGDASAEYFEEIEGSLHVTSQTLAKYLKDNLAVEAGKYGVRMDPRPRPGFYTDRVYYSAPAPGMTDESRLPQKGGEIKVNLQEFVLPDTLVSSYDRVVPPVSLKARPEVGTVKKRPAPRRNFQRHERAYTDAVEPTQYEGFEEGSLVCFSGAEIDKLYVSRGLVSQDRLPSNWYNITFNGELDPSDPLLWTDIVVELANGNFATACVVNKTINTMKLFKAGGTSVLQRRSFGSLEEGKGIFALLDGLHAGSLTEEEIIDAATLSREHKHGVITLGAIIAQFYDSIRDVESLRSMAAFYAMVSQPVPLDIILFGGGRLYTKDGALYADIPATEEREPRSEIEAARRYSFQATPEFRQHPVAGRIPWLGQAWRAVETADCDKSAEEWRSLALSALPHLGSSQFSEVGRDGREAIFTLSGVTDNHTHPTPLVKPLVNYG